MPSNKRPKTFVAVCAFSCAGQRFQPGDEVPPSVALDAALRHGDQFVTSRTPNKKTAATSTEEPSDTESNAVDQAVTDTPVGDTTSSSDKEN